MRTTLSRSAGVGVLIAGALAAGGCDVGAASAAKNQGRSAAGSSAPALPERFERQRIAWTPCGADVAEQPVPGAQCGWVEVPVDYAAPDKGTVKLRVSRAKATDHDRRLGSLLYNPGGPGAGGAADVADGNWQAGERARARYDLVGFDPRGIGGSAPITCPDENSLTDHGLDNSPRGKAEAEETYAAAAERAKACRKASGPVFDHMDSVSVARDLDILRAVLGDKRLNYSGTSYGTFIGQQYMKLFPTKVGRMVLDGVVDPAADMRQVTDLDVKSAEDRLLRFAEACAARSACPLGETGGAVVDRINTFVRQLDERPLAGPDDEELTADTAAHLLTEQLADEEYWPSLADALESAMLGDATPLMRPEPADEESTKEEDERKQAQEALAQSAVLCLDTRGAPRTPQAMLDTAAELAERSPVFGRVNAWTMLDCGTWPVPPKGDVEPIKAPGAAPVLLVSYTDDAATPLSNAQAVQAQLERGSLLIREGTGHGAYASDSACTDRSVDAYLVNGTLPTKKATCAS
ncbi:alpha/beta hydrolase [Streptomyces sp. NPDC021622]|uniref:alpha/beta hydrolase n=1 Tax=Streptomyces sp. NPDC021622 TaxID=3155013 RepID=UPI0033DF9D5C